MARRNDTAEERPNTAQRAALVAKLRAFGYTAAQLGPLIAAGRSRREIVAALIAAQRGAGRG